MSDRVKGVFLVLACMFAYAVLAFLTVLPYLVAFAMGANTRIGGWREHVALAGTIGDSFGVMNAILAFITIILLIYGLYMQRQELGLTRAELRKSSEALSLQANSMEINIEYSTLKLLYDHAANELDISSNFKGYSPAATLMRQTRHYVASKIMRLSDDLYDSCHRKQTPVLIISLYQYTVEVLNQCDLEAFAFKDGIDENNDAYRLYLTSLAALFLEKNIVSELRKLVIALYEINASGMLTEKKQRTQIEYMLELKLWMEENSPDLDLDEIVSLVKEMDED